MARKNKLVYYEYRRERCLTEDDESVPSITDEESTTKDKKKKPSQPKGNKSAANVSQVSKGEGEGRRKAKSAAVVGNGGNEDEADDDSITFSSFGGDDDDDDDGGTSMGITSERFTEIGDSPAGGSKKEATAGAKKKRGTESKGRVKEEAGRSGPKSSTRTRSRVATDGDDDEDTFSSYAGDETEYAERSQAADYKHEAIQEIQKDRENYRAKIVKLLDIYSEFYKWAKQPRVDTLRKEVGKMCKDRNGVNILMLGAPGVGKSSTICSWKVCLADQVSPSEVREIYPPQQNQKNRKGQGSIEFRKHKMPELKMTVFDTRGFDFERDDSLHSRSKLLSTKEKDRKKKILQKVLLGQVNNRQSLDPYEFDKKECRALPYGYKYSVIVLVTRPGKPVCETFLKCIRKTMSSRDFKLRHGTSVELMFLYTSLDKLPLFVHDASTACQEAKFAITANYERDHFTANSDYLNETKIVGLLSMKDIIEQTPYED